MRTNIQVKQLPEMKGLLTLDQEYILYNIIVRALNLKGLEPDLLIEYERTFNWRFNKVEKFVKIMRKLNYDYVLINRLLRIYGIKDESDNINFNQTQNGNEQNT